MNDEKMLELAVRLVAAKVQANYISPAMESADDWIENQISDYWKTMRRVWREGHKSDNVKPIS